MNQKRRDKKTRKIENKKNKNIKIQSKAGSLGSRGYFVSTVGIDDVILYEDTSNTKHQTPRQTSSSRFTMNFILK